MIHIGRACRIAVRGLSSVSNDFAPPDWSGPAEKWVLEHPGGDDKDDVRAQRDEIQNRVADFFDQLDTAV